MRSTCIPKTFASIAVSLTFELHWNSKTQTNIFSGICLGKFLALKPVFRHVEPHLWLNEGDSQSPQWASAGKTWGRFFNVAQAGKSLSKFLLVTFRRFRRHRGTLMKNVIYYYLQMQPCDMQEIKHSKQCCTRKIITDAVVFCDQIWNRGLFHPDVYSFSILDYFSIMIYCRNL